MPDIYISYAWNDRENEADGREAIVDALCQAFAAKQYAIKIDKTDLQYQSSIRAFMEKIGQGNFVITVISHKYLHSKYCMFEAIEVMEKGNERERIFPIVLEDANIYNDVEMIRLINFWEKQVIELKAEVDSIQDDNIKIEPLLVLRDYKKIRDNIGRFLTLIRDMKVLNELVNIKTKFSALITAIDQRMMALAGKNVPVKQDTVIPGVPLVFKALTLLNFTEQYDRFDAYSDYRYGLFYIHGNSASGQYWLARRLVYAVTQGDGEFEIMKVVDSKQNNSDTVERMESLLKTEPGKLFETLAGKLLHKRLIITIDENDPEYFIENFWSCFLHYLETAAPADTKPLFIFLYDGNENKNCQNIINKYQQAKQWNITFCIFPFIELLVKQEEISEQFIEEWLKDVRRIYPELKLPPSMRQEMVQTVLSKNRYLSEQTIRTICKQFNVRYNDVVEYSN